MAPTASLSDSVSLIVLVLPELLPVALELLVLLLTAHGGSHPPSSSHRPYALAWAVLPYGVHDGRPRCGPACIHRVGSYVGWFENDCCTDAQTRLGLPCLNPDFSKDPVVCTP